MPTPTTVPDQPTTQAELNWRARQRRRSLLTNGNHKLGEHIGAWSLPAVDTCPGMTAACYSVCYARRYIARLGIDYSANNEVLRDESFVPRMIAEASMRRVVRIHVSGDFADVISVLKWRAVARACPHTVFYAYTRSWRIPPILEALTSARCELPNFRILYSCDRDSGIPSWMSGQQVAWMAANDQDQPPRAVRIVFRTRARATVRAKLGGSIVCPAENGIRDNGVTCQRCKLCFKEAL